LEDSRQQPLSLGSGFFIKPGVIATNLHVVARATRGSVKLIGQSARHQIQGVLAVDKESDPILLSAPTLKQVPILQLTASPEVSIGDEVFAIGNPQGLEGTISSGIVSGIRSIGTISLIQITAPISPGSSGGPVLSTHGEVIGVAVATFKGGQNLNFAISSQHLKGLLERTPSPTSLEKLERRELSQGLLKDFGNKNITGVVAAHVDCFKPDPSNPFMDWECSFSVQNKLRVPVANVKATLILWGRDGTAVDTREAVISGPIRPGLGVRSSKYFVETNIRRLTSRLEARILDFRVLE
jgi:S1-C subfamily serine protease